MKPMQILKEIKEKNYEKSWIFIVFHRFPKESLRPAYPEF